MLRAIIYNWNQSLRQICMLKQRSGWMATFIIIAIVISSIAIATFKITHHPLPAPSETKTASVNKTSPPPDDLIFKAFSIDRSLAYSARKAGVTHQTIQQLQTIFDASIDLTRDIRTGDQVAFIYKKGSKPAENPVLAVELTNKGRTFKAIRYTDPKGNTGYYGPNGKGLEPRFLGTPVRYKRISSKFDLHRLDPVLNRIHPHLGIDYAAKSGTPIKSIGDGRVIFIGREGGYGKAIKIRYNAHDVALYGHLSRFAAHLRLNSKVHKNEIIGYVGESGWATGPHLHFGFYVNGIPRNWLAMKIPPAKTIPHRYFKQFLAEVQNLANRLPPSTLNLLSN